MLWCSLSVHEVELVCKSVGAANSDVSAGFARRQAHKNAFQAPPAIFKSSTYTSSGILGFRPSRMAASSFAACSQSPSSRRVVVIARRAHLHEGGTVVCVHHEDERVSRRRLIRPVHAIFSQTIHVPELPGIQNLRGSIISERSTAWPRAVLALSKGSRDGRIWRSPSS